MSGIELTTASEQVRKEISDRLPMNDEVKGYVDDKASLLQSDIDAIEAGQISGVIGFTDKSTMDADTSQDTGTVALVSNDSTPANNGWYRWNGSSWVKRDDFYKNEVDPEDTSEAVTGKAVGDYVGIRERFDILTTNRIKPFETVTLLDGDSDMTDSDHSDNYERVFIEGVKGLRLSVPSDSFRGLRTDFSPAKNMPPTQVIGAAIYIESGLENIDFVQVQIRHDGGDWIRTTNNLFGNILSSGQPELRHGWNIIRWRADDSTFGDWDSFDWVRLRVWTKEGGSAAVTVGSVFAEAPEKAKLIFVQDGGYTQFLSDAYPDLVEESIPCTWAINPGLIGIDQNRLSQSDIDTLALDGLSDFSFHSWESQVLENATKEEIYEDTVRCLRYLRSKGLLGEYPWRAAITQNLAVNHAVMERMLTSYATGTSGNGLQTFPFCPSRWSVRRIALHSQTEAEMDETFSRMKKMNSLAIYYTHRTDGGSFNATPEQWDYWVDKVKTGISEGWLEATSVERLFTKYYNRPDEIAESDAMLQSYRTG